VAPEQVDLGKRKKANALGLPECEWPGSPHHSCGRWRDRRSRRRRRPSPGEAGATARAMGISSGHMWSDWRDPAASRAWRPDRARHGRRGAGGDRGGVIGAGWFLGCERPI